MPDIAEETRDLLKYTKKCTERAAITSDRNKELESRRLRAETGDGADPRMAKGSDDEMEITGSRKNAKAAKLHSLGGPSERRCMKR